MQFLKIPKVDQINFLFFVHKLDTSKVWSTSPNATFTKCVKVMDKHFYYLLFDVFKKKTASKGVEMIFFGIY